MKTNTKELLLGNRELIQDTTGTLNSNRMIIDKICKIFVGQYKRVLLIHPPQFPEKLLNVKIAKNKRYYAYPPYGFGLLCANLKKRGYDVCIVDLNMEVLSFIHTEKDEEIIQKGISALWEEILEKSLLNFRPDVVGISCMFTMSHEITIKVAHFIKTHNVDLPIVAGGVHISNAPDIILKECKSIDLVFLYEGDKSFCDFLDIINGKMIPNHLAQVGTLVDEEYISIKKRNIPNPEEINTIPDYLNLPLEKYDSLGEIGTFRYWRPKNSRSSIILSNRGCRGKCSFCSVRNFNGAGVRSRSVESVVNEIQELSSKYNINHITWLDDDFFYDSKRTIELFNEIIKRNLNITWDASNGVIASTVAIHPELIHSAAESGCVGMYFGLESGNPQILRKIRKPSSVNHYIKVGKIMEKYPKIFTRGFLIIGFPKETFRQILDTINMAKAMSLDWYTVQLLTPLPSTEMYHQMVDEGLIQEGSLNMSSAGFTMFSVRESERQRLKEKVSQVNIKDFSDFFEKDLDRIPTKAELGDLWLFVDYKVNYEKIIAEDHPLKLKKMQCFLVDISNRMSIDNPLSTLFLGIVENKLGNLQEAEKYFSLSKKYLMKSIYWQNGFKMLDLERLYNLSAVFKEKGCNDYY